jgi:Tfp pilus assembly protein PilZ
MALITSQQISRYYEQFKNIDVTFTKQVIEATGLQTKQIFLKIVSGQWPSIIYSTSMVGAKIIINLTEAHFEQIRKANNLVSLRFSFKLADKSDPLAFFVTAKITGYNPYNKENKNLHFMSLQYTQRPPDDLIEILGKLLEANINAKKRKDERILITAESIRKLGLKGKDVKLLVQGVPRKGILRDLSFGGAKVIIFGIAKFLVDKEAEIYLELEDQKKILILKGKIIRYDAVEGRKDIAAVGIQFPEDKLPMDYKLLINDYLTHLRKSSKQ